MTYVIGYTLSPPPGLPTFFLQCRGSAVLFQHVPVPATLDGYFSASVECFPVLMKIFGNQRVQGFRCGASALARRIIKVSARFPGARLLAMRVHLQVLRSLAQNE